MFEIVLILFILAMCLYVCIIVKSLFPCNKSDKSDKCDKSDKSDNDLTIDELWNLLENTCNKRRRIESMCQSGEENEYKSRREYEYDYSIVNKEILRVENLIVSKNQ